MISDLNGKAVLVTGSSIGIGAAVAQGFARCGARVAVHAHASRAQGAAVVAAIEQAGGSAVLMTGDVTRSREAERIVNEAAAALSGLDVLVNNAGSMVRRARLAEIDDELFDQVMDLNARSVIAACRAALPHFEQRGQGNIIITGSISARTGGGAGSALYSGAKAFVQTVTRNLAHELAPRRIRVNAVAPGVIHTAFHDRYSTPERLQAIAKTIPLGRVGVAQDCVGAYLFLASDALSGYITGQVIEVNGGQAMP